MLGNICDGLSRVKHHSEVKLKAVVGVICAKNRLFMLNNCYRLETQQSLCLL